MKVKSSTHFTGYWVCEKYFNDIRNELVKEFTPIQELDALSKICFDKLINSNSIAIHIRRGDYVQNNLAGSVLGTLKLNYYHKAFEVIKGKVLNPKWFFFSDDPQWVKDNFIINNAEFIDWNGKDNPERDIYLMANAKHNIIANSTFSWWGAWLNNNNNKIVIAPQNWYKDSEKQKNAKDIIPNDWIKI